MTTDLNFDHLKCYFTECKRAARENKESVTFSFLFSFFYLADMLMHNFLSLKKRSCNNDTNLEKTQGGSLQRSSVGLITQQGGTILLNKFNDDTLLKMDYDCG